MSTQESSGWDELTEDITQQAVTYYDNAIEKNKRQLMQRARRAMTKKFSHHFAHTCPWFNRKGVCGKEVRKQELTNKIGDYFVCGAHKRDARDKLLDKFNGDVAEFNAWLKKANDEDNAPTPAIRRLPIDLSQRRDNIKPSEDKTIDIETLNSDSSPSTPNNWTENNAYSSLSKQLQEQAKQISDLLARLPSPPSPTTLTAQALKEVSIQGNSSNEQ